MAVRQDTLTTGSALRVGGTFATISSVIMALAILFVIPAADSVVPAIELFFLSFLFIAGIVAVLAGAFITWRQKRARRLSGQS